MNKREWLIKIRGDLTQEQAALLCGIKRSTYSNIERGKGLHVDTAKKIAKALKFEWKNFFEDKSAVMKQKQNAS